MSFRLREPATASAAFLILLGTHTASAKDFYVDPKSGAAAGDGSKGAPWQTLEAVVGAGHFGNEVKAGDTVWLEAGYHGAFSPKSGTYNPAITVAAMAGAKAELSRASFNGTHGWVLSGVSISPTYAPTPQTGGTLVTVNDSSTDVTIKGCDLFSVADSSSWTAMQWIDTASSGIEIGGDNVTASHNNLKNVRFGIAASGKADIVEYNQITNFSADGMRGLGDNEVFQYNVVKNVYVDDTAGDDNHDDGFQSWSVGPDGTPGDGVVTGIVLRGNFILNREDPKQKLTNSLQGVGCFDGFFDGWVVENNVVATDHWHGISFYGMKNSRIVNNTVIDINSVSPGPPWIMVTAHKNGTVSENVLVRNNLATDYDVSGNMITQDHNTTLTDLGVYFVDPAKFDLHLLPNAPAVDSGSSDMAPMVDAEGIMRPQGKGVDLGAYESHDPSVMPVEGTGGAGTGSGGTTSSGGASTGNGGTTSSGGASTGNGGKSSGGGGGNASNGGAAVGMGGSQSGTGAAASSGGKDDGSAGEPNVAGTSGDQDAGTGTGSDARDSSGCGCRVTGGTDAPRAALLLLALPLLLRRRRVR